MYFTIKALFADEGYLLRAICLLNHPSNSFREELVCCAYSISQYGGRDPPQRRRFRGAYCVLKNVDLNRRFGALGIHGAKFVKNLRSNHTFLPTISDCSSSAILSDVVRIFAIVAEVQLEDTEHDLRE